LAQPNTLSVKNLHNINIHTTSKHLRRWNMQKVRVAIIGAGPAGLTAALYAARAQLSTVVFIGDKLGGQIATTHDVDNYPGFPDGVEGPELTERMKSQAERFGAKFVWESVTEVDFSKGSPFILTAGDHTYSADAVVVTIGATPRKLGVPGETEFTGRGVSWCATCDGFFFRGKELIVVGGGDSALQEAIFLTKFATNVNVVHRRDSLRASAALQARVKQYPKINFTWDTVVEEIQGNGVVKGARLKNLKTGEVSERNVDGVFIFVGYDPNSTIFKGQLATDGEGYLIVDELKRTSVEGVFAGGEITDKVFRQAITSAGEGCAAALSAIKWLEERESAGLLQPIEEVSVAAGS
jgi:thioredoxin reductase (NADPH)